MLYGRVVVAHNATFDMRFLYRELALARYAISCRPMALCSMKWAQRVIGTAKLTHCCEAFDIPLENAHSALGDARATAALLPHLVNGCRTASEWQNDMALSAGFSWPAPFGVASNGHAVQRGQAFADPHSWLREVLQAAWIPGTTEDEASYLLVLDNALLDRAISRSEGKQLIAAAEGAGLSRATVGRLHHDYLRAVAVEALADEVVTDDERRDLEGVAAALGLGIPYIEEALAWAATCAPKPDGGNAAFQLRPGDRVVFTGETKRSRDDWIAAICSAGLTSGGVTKSTRLLVASDPDSLSGKAVKARQYGVPVVGEEAFERIFSAYCAERDAPQ